MNLTLPRRFPGAVCGSEKAFSLDKGTHLGPPGMSSLKECSSRSGTLTRPLYGGCRGLKGASTLMRTREHVSRSLGVSTFYVVCWEGRVGRSFETVSLGRLSMLGSLNLVLISIRKSAASRHYPYTISARLAVNSSQWAVGRSRRTKGKDCDHGGSLRAIKAALSALCQRYSIPLDYGWDRPCSV